jgi:hypothetical protein
MDKRFADRGVCPVLDGLVGRCLCIHIGIAKRKYQYCGNRFR